jgi:hypothetical protein
VPAQLTLVVYNKHRDSSSLNLYQAQYGGVVGFRLVEHTEAALRLQPEKACYAAFAA